MFWIDKALTGIKKNNPANYHLGEKVCDNCAMPLDPDQFKLAHAVCSHCSHHHNITMQARVVYLLDKGFKSFGEQFTSKDILNFKDRKSYAKRITDAASIAGCDESLALFKGKIEGADLVVAVSDFRFIGGSMGRVMGDRLCHAIDVCMSEKIPLLTICTSGGARMQEGVFSLMQMARISMKLTELAQNALPHLTLLCHPTSGGVSASYAMQADVIIAEPGAMIGFAGPRVIKQTIQGELPEGFQRSESVYKAGAVDMIVPRSLQRERIVSLLNVLTKKDLIS